MPEAIRRLNEDKFHRRFREEEAMQALQSIEKRLVGVSTAIATGGPGAVFWMWIGSRKAGYWQVVEQEQ